MENPCYITFVPETPTMSDTLSKTIYRKLFTDSQWDLIYNFVGNALDDDDYNELDVYMIRNIIHVLQDT